EEVGLLRQCVRWGHRFDAVRRVVLGADRRRAAKEETDSQDDQTANHGQRGSARGGAPSGSDHCTYPWHQDMNPKPERQLEFPRWRSAHSEILYEPEALARVGLPLAGASGSRELCP